MCFSLALAAFASVLSVYAANIPIEVGANNEAAAQSDGASILSSVASDIVGAVPTVTSVVASAVKGATSTLPSVIGDVTSAAGGAINTATSVLPSVIGDVTSAAEGAFNTATSEIPNIVSDVTGVIGDATAAVGGLLGAGVRIDASALSFIVGVGIAVILL